MNEERGRESKDRVHVHGEGGRIQDGEGGIKIIREREGEYGCSTL